MKSELREIALWLSGKYTGGIGESSKYVLSRCMGIEKEEITYNRVLVLLI